MRPIPKAYQYEHRHLVRPGADDDDDHHSVIIMRKLDWVGKESSSSSSGTRCEKGHKKAIEEKMQFKNIKKASHSSQHKTIQILYMPYNKCHAQFIYMYVYSICEKKRHTDNDDVLQPSVINKNHNDLINHGAIFFFIFISLLLSAVHSFVCHCCH